jgi:poly [ADP-ribose] polymerase
MESKDLGQLLSDHGALVVVNINSRVTHVVCDTKDTSGAVELAYKHGCKLIREDYFHTAIKTKKNKISDADLIDDDEMESKSNNNNTKAVAKKPIAKKNNNVDEEEESTSSKKRKREDSDEESEGEKPQKKKQKTDKKLLPVDSQCSMASRSHIYVDGDEVWSCMLNQTNIGNNNNKFYMLQLAESNDKKQYWVWMRWGRVGAKGQSSLISGSSLKNAMGVFESKFTEKTGNAWSNRAKFISKNGKYTMIDIDHGDESEEEEDEDKPKKKSLIDASVPSKLDDKVKKLIELIFNRTAMISQMEKMNYDVKKMPLGKLKKSTLDKGYAALKKIESALKSGSGDLKQLSSDFYTLIPHNYGMKTPPVINSTNLLKEKLQMLETLTDIEIANKLESESEEKQEPMHPTDARYRTLKTTIKTLDKKSDKFKVIEKFVKTTHATTHDKYTLKVLDVFEVDRENERKKFVKHCEELFAKDGEKAETNTQLLWHGSRVSNYVGILSQGLRIAPPEAPSTGYMFGKGLYFADMVSKSANYCHVDFKKKKSLDEDGESVDHTGILLLCEVALGKSWELTAAKYVTKLDPKYQSVLGAGATGPEKDNAVAIDSPSTKNKLVDLSVKVPVGPCKDTGLEHGKDTDLLYNEFIVYHPDQVVVSYMVKFDFTATGK